MFFLTATLSQCEDSGTFKNVDDDVEKDDGDMSSPYGFLNSHNISKREDQSIFKNIDGDVDKGDVSSGGVSMNGHMDLQQNDLEYLIKDNYRIDKYMNETLKNVYARSGIGLINIHTTPKIINQVNRMI